MWFMMTLPDAKASKIAIHLMKERGYGGQITASVRYKDEIPMLKQAGIDAAYVLFEEAGVGFANHVCEHANYCHPQDTGLSS